MGAYVCCQQTELSGPAQEVEVEETVVDLGKLRQQLADVEGDQQAQDRLFERLQRSGIVMIATLSIHEQDQARQLRILGLLRGLLATCVWSEKIRLVKPDECKFFVFSTCLAATLAAAIQIVRLAELFPSWLLSVAPELGAVELPPLVVKIGIEAGQALLLPGDCYGDPMNVASKLGEDIAEAGQLCLGAAFTSAARADAEATAHLAALEATEARCEISKVEMQYLTVPLASAAAATARPITLAELPERAEVARISKGQGQNLDEEARAETAAIFVSDMSGFTSLTKKYGILHYLRLVLNVRHIFVQLLDLHGGRVIKYDGDNIIAIFPACNVAMACISQAWAEIQKYNEGREKDFQIRMGCALDYGEVLLQGSEIVGEAFESAFHLAEEVSEVKEVLVTEKFKEQIKKDSPAQFKVSSQRAAEHASLGKLIHRSVEFK